MTGVPENNYSWGAMIVHSIEQIIKKDIPLYYRNEYSGLAILESPQGERQEAAIEFSVEIQPTGDRVINVKVKERINYPLIPVIKVLKETILVMEKEGLLR